MEGKTLRRKKNCNLDYRMERGSFRHNGLFTGCSVAFFVIV